MDCFVQIDMIRIIMTKIRNDGLVCPDQYDSD